MADDNSKIVGAAAAGALIGVFFQQPITTVGLLALLGAYLSTLSNSVGEVASSVGGTTADAYSKAKELNKEYEILPKAKTAADTVVTVADNINTNYGLTTKLDEKLKLTAKVGDLKAKVGDVTSSITEKVDELKSSATTGTTK
jgi:hypothetical protein